MFDAATYAMSRKYTDSVSEGLGSLKGSPCQIKSTTETDKQSTIVFEWEGKNGTHETSSITVKNGQPGDTGNGIQSITKESSTGKIDTYKILFTDNTSTTFTVTNATTVDNLSQLNNDTGFITNTVNNLINYYTKTDTYSKDEISKLLQNISAGLSVMVVTTLPTANISTTTIYLVKDNVDNNSYEQWMYISNKWASLGTTTIDLSNYYTKDKINNLLLGYVTTSTLLTVLVDYVKKSELAKVATSGSYNDLLDLPTILSTDGFATIDYVDAAMANSNHLTRKIVDVVPTDEEASEKVIYMLKIENATGNDKYQEYMKIDGTVQLTGDTSVDLSDYAKSEDIPTVTNDLTDELKANYDSAYTHSTSAHAPTEAEKNTIQTIKINGIKVVPNENREVEITVPSIDNLATTEYVDNAISDMLQKELYGFKIDQNESDPASMISYIEDNRFYQSAHMNYETNAFDYGDWENAFFMQVRPCMLKYDGTVDYYLNPNDYSLKEDGTPSDIANVKYAGNAMIEFPKAYWKIVDNSNNTANIYISNKKLDDNFHCWSHLDNNGNEIDYCYMPIYNGYNDGTRLRSLSGKTPIHTQTATTEIKLAVANNTSGSNIWYTEVFSDRMLVNLLLLLIGKSTDTQSVFGNGYYTGGSQNTNSRIATGTMNNKGLFWGSNGSSMVGVKVFGMEHWWGNQWRRIAGWINDKGTQKVKMTYGKSDGSTVNGYNTTGSGYLTIANATPSGTNEGYISGMVFNKNGVIPKIANGSATTYYTDGLWFNNPQVNYVSVGGRSNHGLRVGALCSLLIDAASYAYWAVGAAVSCKPLA